MATLWHCPQHSASHLTVYCISQGKSFGSTEENLALRRAFFVLRRFRQMPVFNAPASKTPRITYKSRVRQEGPFLGSLRRCR